MTAMHGKTVVITGGTGGIGNMTALALAKMGAHVVIVGRSAPKLAAALEAVRAAAQHDRVSGELADLSEIAQVVALADRLNAAYPRIDVLINNAGAFFPSRQLTREGLEMTFALNHMSYFALTTRLLDTLIGSAPARIINVSSDAHRLAGLNFDDLQASRGYNTMVHYARTKLMNVLFTMELVRKLALRGVGADRVTVNALHPGFVASSFFTGKLGVMGLGMKVMTPIMRLTGTMISAEQGARTSVFLASSPNVQGVSGAYFDENARMVRPAGAAYDDADAKRLWALSEQIMADKLAALA